MSNDIENTPGADAPVETPETRTTPVETTEPVSAPAGAPAESPEPPAGVLTDARGEEILSDPSTPPADRAEHPDGLPEKLADQTPGGGIADAESNDPPIRTDRPDVPIVQRLGTGAGQHTPPDDPHINAEGRYVPPVEQPADAGDSSAPAE